MTTTRHLDILDRVAHEATFHSDIEASTRGSGQGRSVTERALWDLADSSTMTYSIAPAAKARPPASSGWTRSNAAYARKGAGGSTATP